MCQMGRIILRRCYVAGVLNTFDCYGSHSYQHLKTNEEIKQLVFELQPDSGKCLTLKNILCGHSRLVVPFGWASNLGYD